MGAAKDRGAQCLSSFKALNEPFTKMARGTWSMRAYGGVEGSPPCDPSEAVGIPAFDEDAAVGASAEEEGRFLERAAIEGMAVHLWESNTIRNASTAVPTVCKPNRLQYESPISGLALNNLINRMQFEAQTTLPITAYPNDLPPLRCCHARWRTEA